MKKMMMMMPIEKFLGKILRWRWWWWWCLL